VKRRQFIALLGGAAAWPLAARAQQPRKVWHIGLLAPSPPTPSILNALRNGLSERGYIEGQNLFIEVRWPRGSFEQNPNTAAELVGGNVDVIVAWATPAVIAARRATSTIPIVMVSIGDPVGVGLVVSLARPGGNITGLSNISRDVSGKLVGIFAEIVPGMQHVGVIHNPNNPSLAYVLQETEHAIRALGLQLTIVGAKSVEEFESAFALLSKQGANGVVLISDPSIIEHGARIIELAKSGRLPTAFQRRESVEMGGLVSYGANLNEQFHRATYYIDRILKGDKPAELPVEQPTKFDLVINLKAAKALGIAVPPTLLAIADEVIE
jgi:putative tryptophan/tyrosine transport system substrate-binding protein